MEHPLGKSGSRDAASRNWKRCARAGRSLFRTAVSVRRGDVAHRRGRRHARALPSAVRAEIERYVDCRTAFRLRGSFKSEGLGIALFDAI
jgi:septum formation protein